MSKAAEKQFLEINKMIKGIVLGLKEQKKVLMELINSNKDISVKLDSQLLNERRVGPVKTDSKQVNKSVKRRNIKTYWNECWKTDEGRKMLMKKFNITATIINNLEEKNEAALDKKKKPGEREKAIGGFAYGLIDEKNKDVLRIMNAKDKAAKKIEQKKTQLARVEPDEEVEEPPIEVQESEEESESSD
jgi:hypothetical protein